MAVITEMLQQVDKVMLRLRRYREIIVTGILFCFFLFLRIFIHSFVDVDVGGARWRFIAPDFWPIWILNFAVLISAGILFSAIKDVYKEIKDSAAKQPIGEPATEMPTAKELGRTLGVVGITLVYLYLMPILGFFVSTIVFGIVYLLFLRERQAVTLISAPIFLVLLIYIVFTQLLVVPLPRGIGIFYAISTFLY
jgi:hypothetical protein